VTGAHEGLIRSVPVNGAESTTGCRQFRRHRLSPEGLGLGKVVSTNTGIFTSHPLVVVLESFAGGTNPHRLTVGEFAGHRLGEEARIIVRTGTRGRTAAELLLFMAGGDHHHGRLITGSRPKTRFRRGMVDRAVHAHGVARVIRTRT